MSWSSRAEVALVVLAVASGQRLLQPRERARLALGHRPQLRGQELLRLRQRTKPLRPREALSRDVAELLAQRVVGVATDVGGAGIPQLRQRVGHLLGALPGPRGVAGDQGRGPVGGESSGQGVGERAQSRHAHLRLEQGHRVGQGAGAAGGRRGGRQERPELVERGVDGDGPRGLVGGGRQVALGRGTDPEPGGDHRGDPVLGAQQLQALRRGAGVRVVADEREHPPHRLGQPRVGQGRLVGPCLVVGPEHVQPQGERVEQPSAMVGGAADPGRIPARDEGVRAGGHGHLVEQVAVRSAGVAGGQQRDGHGWASQTPTVSSPDGNASPYGWLRIATSSGATTSTPARARSGAPR